MQLAGLGVYDRPIGPSPVPTTRAAYALDAAVADEVVDVQVLVVVVGAVAPDGEPLFPGRRAADLELLLVGDGPAALADAAEGFGWAHDGGWGFFLCASFEWYCFEWVKRAPV
ncbi:uncharacterized protein PG986_002676 [Apiospora aurea]|uniref:Uncharacterized protein n=1 Tax=Apiospora aurea TaxID=335848 RepID=A0ABR1QPI1_9PEZI